jgi:hypothetical protein
MSEVGQKAKYSLRAHIVRFAPETGLKSDIAGGPFRANTGNGLARGQRAFCQAATLIRVYDMMLNNDDL